MTVRAELWKLAGNSIIRVNGIENVLLSLAVEQNAVRRRPSLCYAAPGHSLLSTSGTTRNMLSLASALSQWADVTLAFRNIEEPIDGTAEYGVIAIEPSRECDFGLKDDVAARGLNPFAHLAYIRELHRFAKHSGSAYDLVLEKGWRLSGVLLGAFRRYGVPGVLIENDVRHWNETIGNARALAKYALHWTAQCIARSSSRRVPLIIAETDELKTMLIERRGILPDRLEVVGLGVDHSLFRPMDQRSCRESLGFNPKATVLLYVGSMDQYHDLAPVIDALTRTRLHSLELHILGSGECRTPCEEKAKFSQNPVKFHGQVPHDKVPEFIAAADVCLAPYNVSAFHNEVIPFSTLKVPEYMACERPVISVPSGQIERLIEDQVSGFLFPNSVSSWVAFLNTLPSRQRMKEMGQVAARAIAPLSWEGTAARYLEISQQLIAGR